MSAEIINLRQAKKARARADKEAHAAGNRAKFGRTKAERKQSDAERDLERRHIDAHQTSGVKPGDDTTKS